MFEENPKKYLRNNRMFVRVGGQAIPYANYVWLKGNPCFSSIPKGYAIHHLDKDNFNDDISNLVLIQKHHHTAYHLKNKIIETTVEFDPDSIKEMRTLYFPTKEPGIYKITGEHRKSERYRIYFSEKIDGKSKRMALSSWDGKPISSLEMAQRIKDYIWKK